MIIDSVDTDDIVDLGQQNVVITLSNSPDPITKVEVGAIEQVIVGQTALAADAREVTINLTGYIPDGTNTIKVTA